MALLAEHLHEGGLRIASLRGVVIMHEILGLPAPGAARLLDVRRSTAAAQQLSDALRDI